MSDAAPGVAPATLQDMVAGIPAHAAHSVSVEYGGEGIRMRAHLDGRSARGEGLTQVHGGVIAALLDTATTMVIVALTSNAWGTVDLRVDYLRPLALGGVTVDAAVLKAGRRVARTTASLYDVEGRLAATATATLVPDVPVAP